MRGLARALLLVLLAMSAFATWRTGLAVARDPMLRPLVEATADEIIAATDRMMASAATSDRMATLIRARLAEDPRNWIALDALQEVVSERALVLPQEVVQALADARTEDDGLFARLGGCAVCDDWFANSGMILDGLCHTLESMPA